MPRLPTDPLLPVKISDALREARKRARLTQKAAADAAGVDPQTISRWERGERNPSVADVNHLIAIYNEVVRGGAVPRHNVSRGTVAADLVGEDGAVYQVKSSAGGFPRHLEGMVRRLEADIYQAELPAPQQDALLYTLRNPELMTLYRMGFEEGRQTVEQQQAQMEIHIDVVRRILAAMVADLNRQLRRS